MPVLIVYQSSLGACQTDCLCGLVERLTSVMVGGYFHSLEMFVLHGRFFWRVFSLSSDILQGRFLLEGNFTFSTILEGRFLLENTFTSSR